MYLKNSDQTKYGDICVSFHNQYTRGIDQYPADLPRAYSMVIEHKNEHTLEGNINRNRKRYKDNETNKVTAGGYLSFNKET